MNMRDGNGFRESLSGTQKFEFRKLIDVGSRGVWDGGKGPCGDG